MRMSHQLEHLQAICRVSFMSRLVEDPVLKGLAGEPSYRGFCESPSADLLRGLPVGSSGPGFRMSPVIVAGRLSKMYAYRLLHSAASPGGSHNALTTRKFKEPEMKELKPVIAEVATALMKASRNRYSEVSGHAIEAFTNNITEVGHCIRSVIQLRNYICTHVFCQFTSAVAEWFVNTVVLPYLYVPHPLGTQSDHYVWSPRIDNGAVSFTSVMNYTTSA